VTRTGPDGFICLPVSLLERLLTVMCFYLVVMLMQDFSDDERKRLRSLLLEEARKLCPEDPATLKGVSLVAIGRK
jgi:hypothetical protein